MNATAAVGDPSDRFPIQSPDDTPRKTTDKLGA